MTEPSELAKAAWEQSGGKLGEAERILAESLYRQLIYGQSDDLSWIGKILKAFRAHSELIDIDDREALKVLVNGEGRRNPLADLGDVTRLIGR